MWGEGAVAVQKGSRRGRPPASSRTPEETRALLIEAASEVFADRGYVGASIKAIADRAGVTSGTIYCHFENKADLLVEVIREQIKDPHHYGLQLEQVAEEGMTAADLARIVSVYAAKSRAHVRKLSLELHAAAVKEEVVADVLDAFNRQSHETLCAVIDKAKARGAVSSHLSASHTAHLFHVMILGLSQLETLEPSLIGDRTWMNFLEDSVIRILCCEHGN